LGNALYESVLARLVQVSPLLARGLLDEGLERSGLHPDRITATQMQDVVSRFLSQELEGVDLDGMASGVLVADHELRYVSPQLRTFLLAPLLTDSEQLERLEEMGVLPPVDTPIHVQRSCRVTCQHPFRRALCVGWCTVPGPEGTPLRVAFVRDETLEAGLSGEVMQVQQALTEANLEQERLTRELLEQERALTTSLQRSLDAERRAVLESERMAALGRLLGGIAHELNNLLGPILGYSQLLLQRDLPDTHREAADRIETASQMAAQVVRSLLVFANPRVGDESPGDLNQAVRDVGSVLDGVWAGRGIQVQMNLAPDLPASSADMGQARSIALNLAMNATQAIGDRPGRIVLTTREADDEVELRVDDDGGGIDEDRLDDLFESFVTTRESSGGLGLGLSIVRGLVSAAGGTITANNVGEGDARGARFVVRVPCRRQAAARPRVAVDSEPSASTVRGQRCLVVDDEPALLALVQEVLGEAGLVVDTASCAVDAIALTETEDYDLLVTDIRMPEMDGLELMDILRQADPTWSHRVLFITGDVLDSGLEQRIERTGAGVLHKPFDIQRLTDAVVRVLSRA
jgi:signal transduction histidine kinase